MKKIITSMLDDDLYKFTQQQCILRQYPSRLVSYSFVCRNKDVKLGFLKDKIQEQIESMVELKLSSEEVTYLSKISFMKPDYIKFLLNYRYNPEEVKISNLQDELHVFIHGNWHKTILWEVKLLSIINQLYFEHTTKFKDIKYDGQRILQEKIELIKEYPNFIFADFGTRRRYSSDWHKFVVKTLHKKCPQNFIGTSNVRLAMENNIKPIGTMAHEWISAHMVLVGESLEREAQRRAFYIWLQEYGTNLGIALTDTFTTKAFFRDFDYTLAKSFSGVRQDSGDPIIFGHKMIEHYKKLGIDPKTKIIVFSDGLDFNKAIKIYKEFTGLIGISFGIGTNLTNSLGPKPLNIVIKLISCHGSCIGDGMKPVVKLSDDITKAIGDKDVIELMKKIYKL